MWAASMPDAARSSCAGARAGYLAHGEVGDGQVDAAVAGQGVQDGGAEAAFGVVVLRDHQPARVAAAAAASVAASAGLTE